MRLSELLNGVRILDGNNLLEKEISMICSDSRKVVKNGVFVAIKGEKRDGNDYIDEAVQNGAIVVITDQKDVFLKFENVVLTENSRAAISYMWNNYYKNPTSNIKIVAITGTNGKTSCAYYLYNILKQANKKRGLISTVECLINDQIIETNGGSEVLDIDSAMTTPDPEILYSIFNKMRENGVEYIVMEASSHALKQLKLDPIKISYAIFTNLSPEHLDFHQNMEDYFNAKKMAFQKETVGIVNADDDYGKLLIKENEKFYSCSIKDECANFFAKNIELSKIGNSYVVDLDRKDMEINTIQIGEFSIYNSLLSSVCAYLMGMKIEDIELGIHNTKIIRGRLEKIEGVNIYIDYAHTPYAMQTVLNAIKKSHPGKRIISLFGCGGDRDKGKRAKMGKIASCLSDFCIITNDNSRSENPENIIAEILSGIQKEKSYVVIPKREEAINYAISKMNKEDILILFGKGHETYQIDRNGKSFFDERKIIYKAIKNDKN